MIAKSQARDGPDQMDIEHPLSKSSAEDLYVRLKTLQRQLDFIAIQEDYIKDEQKNLKREFLRAQEEIKRIQSVPLVIGQFFEMIDPFTAIVGSTIGDLSPFPFPFVIISRLELLCESS